MQIDTRKNHPNILKDEEFEWAPQFPGAAEGAKPAEPVAGEHGTCVSIEMEASYVRGRLSVDEYLQQCAVVNPHLQLHYRIVGAGGPYVVVLSGGPGLDVDYMASVSERLKDSYRVVFHEQRGTGRSMLPVLDERTLDWRSYLGDLEALRVGLGEDRLTLLGHSWGMTYGLAYAAAYPDRTRGVISLGSAPITSDFMQLFDDNRSSRLHPSEREQLAYWSDPERRRADPDRALLEYLRAITPTDFWDRAKGIEHAMRWRLEWCHAGVGDVVERTIWATLDLRSELVEGDRAHVRVHQCPVAGPMLVAVKRGPDEIPPRR